MILIADGGSTKVDWIALRTNKQEAFRLRTLGLNPAVVPEEELKSRIDDMHQLINIKEEVTEIHFYGAGCGTPKPVEILRSVMKEVFTNATISIAEDMLAAVYATSGNTPAIVCILGTGSNSCYYNGREMEMGVDSLGYSLMDEASGNYFGKKLIVDFFYKKMPANIAKYFEQEYNLDADFIKMNLYRKPNPNMYLASFAKFMFEYKEEKYIKKLIKKGFKEFFKCRILSYKKDESTPVYFVGSIAYYFKDILEEIAYKNGFRIADVIQRPIDNLLEYHKKQIN